MKKILIIMAFLFICNIIYSEMKWTEWYGYFYYNGKVSCTYSIKYDNDLKSIVLQLDHYSPDAEGITEPTEATGKIFKLVKNNNPSYFMHVKTVLDNVLDGVANIYTSNMGQSAYGYFSLYYDTSDNATNIKIQGIKTRAYKQ